MLVHLMGQINSLFLKTRKSLDDWQQDTTKHNHLLQISTYFMVSNKMKLQNFSSGIKNRDLETLRLFVRI